jgi:polyisoprenoid-binding protein YceI
MASLAFTAIAWAAPAPAANTAAPPLTIWKIDPDHSSIGFKVKHMMVSWVYGQFDKFTGEISLKDSALETVKLTVDIDVNSINTRNEKRDTHLRSVDFFDAAKFPKMSFTAKKAKSLGGGKLQVFGDFTLHGITKEVVLAVEGPTLAMKNPYGKIVRGASATTTINRKDFGLAWNVAIEAGGVLVGDEVTILLEVELVKQ